MPAFALQPQPLLPEKALLPVQDARKTDIMNNRRRGRLKMRFII